MDTDRIKAELDRIGADLAAYPMPNEHAGLYAAQQALIWALNPELAKSPYDMVKGIPRRIVGQPIRAEPFNTEPCAVCGSVDHTEWNIDGRNPHAVTVTSMLVSN